jgi:hypothetical protein
VDRLEALLEIGADPLKQFCFDPWGSLITPLNFVGTFD